MPPLFDLLQRSAEHGVPEPVSTPSDLVLVAIVAWGLVMAGLMVSAFSRARVR